MYGVPLGFVDSEYKFVDYERLVFPQMRIVDKNCFKSPEPLHLPSTVTLTHMYGIDLVLNRRYTLNQTTAAPANSAERVSRNERASCT